LRTGRFNGGHQRPLAAWLDLIAGLISGPASDRSCDRNGVAYQLSYLLHNMQQSQYISLCGTNQCDELELKAYSKGENPWIDLCFCSNPVFIEVGSLVGGKVRAGWLIIAAKPARMLLVELV